MQGQDFQSAVKSRAANSERGLAKRAISGNQSGSKSQMGGGEKAIKRKTSDISVSSPAAIKEKENNSTEWREKKKK